MPEQDNNILTPPFEPEERPDISTASIIKVIGVGGGGGNAANYLYKQGLEKVSFLACNTDMRSLQRLKVPNRIILGPEVTHGLGAGDQPELGRQAAEASQEDIRRELSDGTRMVFVTAGMGGGTGTGAAPVVASVAQEMGILTIGIVTIPFFFEGERKIIKALKGAEEMRKHVDSLLIVNNERLTEIYRDLTLMNAFQKADDTLANATRSIAEMINTTGYIDVDFNDVQTTLKQSSTAIISTGYGEGEHRVTKAIQDALHSPLLRNSDIRTSKRLLFYLYFNPEAEEPVSMEEMNEITQFSGTLSKSIDIKWGACYDETLGDRVKMTILSSGFELTISDGTQPGSDAVITFGGEPAASSRHAAAAVSAAATPESEMKTRIEQEYGSGKMTEHARAMAKANYVVLQPSQFDNDEVIALFAAEPAFSRSLALKDKLRALGTPAQVEKQPEPQEAPAQSPRAGSGTIKFA